MSAIAGSASAIKQYQLGSIYDFSLQLSATDRLEEMLALVPRAVEAVTGSSEIAVALLCKESKGYVIDRQAMLSTSPFPEHIIDKEERLNIVKTVVMTNKPFLVLLSRQRITYDWHDDRDFDDALLCVVPMSVCDRSIGFLSAVAKEDRLFNVFDVAFLAIIASQTAIAIENSRLHRRMHDLILAEERGRIAKDILSVIMKEAPSSGPSPPLRCGQEELTRKELQVLALMARGHTNEQIARELWVGLKTVKTHVSNILRKLEQKNRVRAIICGVKRGLIDFEID